MRGCARFLSYIQCIKLEIYNVQLTMFLGQQCTIFSIKITLVKIIYLGHQSDNLHWLFHSSSLDNCIIQNIFRMSCSFLLTPMAYHLFVNINASFYAESEILIILGSFHCDFYQIQYVNVEMLLGDETAQVDVHINLGQASLHHNLYGINIYSTSMQTSLHQSLYEDYVLQWVVANLHDDLLEVENDSHSREMSLQPYLSNTDVDSQGLANLHHSSRETDLHEVDEDTDWAGLHHDDYGFDADIHSREINFNQNLFEVNEEASLTNYLNNANIDINSGETNLQHDLWEVEEQTNLYNTDLDIYSGQILLLRNFSEPNNDIVDQGLQTNLECNSNECDVDIQSVEPMSNQMINSATQTQEDSAEFDFILIRTHGDETVPSVNNQTLVREVQAQQDESDYNVHYVCHDPV